MFLKSNVLSSLVSCTLTLTLAFSSCTHASSDPPTAFTTASATPFATTAATTATRRYNPGHYIALLSEYGSQAFMARSLKPGARGFLKRYKWRDLEPTYGNYDFSEIRSDLAWTAANGMRLIVMIEDKSFTSTTKPTPAYLDAYALPNKRGGVTIARWNPYVTSRMQSLVAALGRFDGNWNFEGVATQESALSLERSVLDANGYTPEKYRDYFIGVLSTAGNNLPHARVFWFVNFLARKQAYIAAIADAVADKGVVMGGPDVLPDDSALVRMMYPYYDQFRDKMPLFGQVEGECYAALHKTCCYSTKYWTVPELFRFARDQLHVDYMFWVRVSSPSVLNSYDWSDTWPVMEYTPTFNN